MSEKPIRPRNYVLTKLIMEAHKPCPRPKPVHPQWFAKRRIPALNGHYKKRPITLPKIDN